MYFDSIWVLKKKKIIFHLVVENNFQKESRNSFLRNLNNDQLTIVYN